MPGLHFSGGNGVDFIKSDNRRFLRRFISFYDLMQGTAEIHMTAFAASSAFFLFLSLVPIILLVCSLVPYTGLTQEAAMEIVSDNLGHIVPENVTQLLEGIVDEIYSGGLLTLSVSAIATVWSAGKAFLAIMRGLDVIHGDGLQNYFIARFKACLYTIVMMGAILFLLLVVVFGGKIVGIVTLYVPELSPILHWLLNQRFVFSVCLLTVTFTAIYTWVPQKKLRLLAQLPGALFTSLGWMAISWMFSTYISMFDGFSAYGSLATIVIAMLWMYYCMFILLLGAYFNAKQDS